MADISIYKNLLAPPKSAQEYEADGQKIAGNYLGLEESRLKLKAAKRAEADDAALRATVSGAGGDLEKASTDLLNRGLVKPAMDLRKSRLEGLNTQSQIDLRSSQIPKNRAETDAKLYETQQAKTFDRIRQVALWDHPDQARAALRQQLADPTISPEARQKMFDMYDTLPTRPEDMPRWQMNVIKQGAKASELLNAAQQERTAAETARHNRETETTQRAQVGYAIGQPVPLPGAQQPAVPTPLPNQQQPSASPMPPAPKRQLTESENFAIEKTATRLGISPADLKTIIQYETAGTFSPSVMGGDGGKYMGLIQFGPEEQRKYGVAPNQSFEQQMTAVENYLRDRGVKPGHDLSRVYATVSGGNPNVPLTARDSNGSIAEHVARMGGGTETPTAPTSGLPTKAGDAAAAASAKAAADMERQRLANQGRLDAAKAPKPIVVTGADGNVKLIDEKGNEVKDLGKVGKPSANYEKQQTAKTNMARDLDRAITELEKATADGGLIDKSTGSGAGALVDAAAGFVGKATKGAVAVGQLRPIYDLVLKMVPRFEGPQSDKDTRTYENAAGQLANPAVPNAQKKAAGREILRLMKERRGQFADKTNPDTEPGASRKPPPPPGFQ